VLIVQNDTKTTQHYFFENLLSTFLIASSASQGLPDDINPATFMIWRGKQLQDKCPSGVKSCECVGAPGTTVDGPFLWEEDPIGTIFTYIGCNPGFCTCTDGKVVDTRQVVKRHI
jgi:hypothetical protein